jgi:hypothetical protein
VDGLDLGMFISGCSEASLHISVLSSVPEEGSAFVARRTLLECAASACTELGEMGFISDFSQNSQRNCTSLDSLA